MRDYRAVYVGVLMICGASCAPKTSRERFELAEDLWNKQRYAAAASEYERVANREKNQTLGQQALYKLAMTQYLYLNKSKEALNHFLQILDSEKTGVLAFQAYRHAGDILFLRLEDYARSEAHYAQAETLFPDTEELAQFLFRLGKSQIKTGKLVEGAQTLEGLTKRFPASEYSQLAQKELVFGYILKARRERSPESLKKALAQIENHLLHNRDIETQVQFLNEKAEILEETKKEEQALKTYESMSQLLRDSQQEQALKSRSVQHTMTWIEGQIKRLKIKIERPSVDGAQFKVEPSGKARQTSEPAGEQTHAE